MEDQMECVCGEILKGEQISPEERAAGKKELGNLARQFQEHMMRPDHQPNPGQWATAHERVQEAKEKAKKSRDAEPVKK